MFLLHDEWKPKQNDCTHIKPAIRQVIPGLVPCSDPLGSFASEAKLIGYCAFAHFEVYVEINTIHVRDCWTSGMLQALRTNTAHA
jgi:hypothetical protein